MKNTGFKVVLPDGTEREFEQGFFFGMYNNEEGNGHICCNGNVFSNGITHLLKDCVRAELSKEEK